MSTSQQARRDAEADVAQFFMLWHDSVSYYADCALHSMHPRTLSLNPLAEINAVARIRQAADCAFRLCPELLEA